MTDRRLLCLIFCLIPLGQVAIDIYMPSLPGMVQDLNSSAMTLQWSLTVFLIGFSWAQLVFGPLSDAWGRLKALNLGLGLYVLGSALCVCATDSGLFLLGRALQGLGIGVAPLTGTAALGDRYRGRQLSRYTSYSSIAYSLPTIIAPVIGSYLDVWMGWRSNFYLLLIAGLAILIFANATLFETRSEVTRQRTVREVIRQLRGLLAAPIFLAYICCMAFSFTLMVAFSINGAFFFQQTLGISVTAFGRLALYAGIAYLLGAGVNSFLLRWFDTLTLLKIGIWSTFASSLIFLLASGVDDQHVLMVFAPIALTLFCSGLIFPNAMSLSLSGFPNQSGLVSALIGFFVSQVAGLISFILSQFPTSSPIYLAMIYSLLCGMLAFLSGWFKKPL